MKTTTDKATKNKWLKYLLLGIPGLIIFALFGYLFWLPLVIYMFIRLIRKKKPSTGAILATAISFIYFVVLVNSGDSNPPDRNHMIAENTSSEIHSSSEELSSSIQTSEEAEESCSAVISSEEVEESCSVETSAKTESETEDTQALPTTDEALTSQPPATQAPATAAPTTQVPPTAAPTQAPTQPPTTAPTQAPTQAPTIAPTQPAATTLTILSYPEIVHRNEMATVKIQGAPNTNYSITVYYKSGPSEAAGLETKISDANGYVSWTWKVGGRTSAGTFQIVVSGGGETKSVHFTVVV